MRICKRLTGIYLLRAGTNRGTQLFTHCHFNSIQFTHSFHQRTSPDRINGNIQIRVAGNDSLEPVKQLTSYLSVCLGKCSFFVLLSNSKVCFVNYIPFPNHGVCCVVYQCNISSHLVLRFCILLLFLQCFFFSSKIVAHNLPLLQCFLVCFVRIAICIVQPAFVNKSVQLHSVCLVSLHLGLLISMVVTVTLQIAARRKQFSGI